MGVCVSLCVFVWLTLCSFVCLRPPLSDKFKMPTSQRECERETERERERMRRTKQSNVIMSYFNALQLDEQCCQNKTIESGGALR